MRAGITNYVHVKYFASHPHSAMHNVMHFDKDPARFPARLVEICNRLQEPIALAVQICDELSIEFANREDMIAYALRSQAGHKLKADRLAAKIGGTPIADLIAFVETMDISGCPRYPAIVLAQHDEPASPATDEPYQLVQSDALDFAADCLAKCTELGYQTAEPEAPIGLIDLTITRNKQQRRDAAKQYGFARGDSAGEWLTNAREHNRMLSFVEARTAPTASRPLRIAADPVVKSTVTKARKPYRHCGSGLQNNPVKRPTPKPIALMVMLGSMVDLAVLFVGAVGVMGVEQSEDRISVKELAALCGHAYDNNFRQKLRMTAVVSHHATKDSVFSKMLDASGFNRACRSTWMRQGVPSSAIGLIMENITQVRHTVATTHN